MAKTNEKKKRRRIRRMIIFLIVVAVFVVVAAQVFGYIESLNTHSEILHGTAEVYVFER